MKPKKKRKVYVKTTTYMEMIEGDIVQKGDEYLDNDVWVKAQHTFGQSLKLANGEAWRRPVSVVTTVDGLLI